MGNLRHWAGNHAADSRRECPLYQVEGIACVSQCVFGVRRSASTWLRARVYGASRSTGGVNMIGFVRIVTTLNHRKGYFLAQILTSASVNARARDLPAFLSQ